MGGSWFQNGRPPLERMLHNIWNLSPFVPGFSLGQNALANRDFANQTVDSLMAGALLSHITFFNDIRGYPDAVIERVRVWTDFYKRRRDLLDGVVYPLLDDPIERGWTALQSWDPEAGDGALLAFRQDSPDTARTIRLENVPDGNYALTSGPGDQPLWTVPANALRSGLEVEIPEAEGARVILIRRLPPQPQPGPEPSPGAVTPGSAGLPLSTVTRGKRKCKKRKRLRRGKCVRKKKRKRRR